MQNPSPFSTNFQSLFRLPAAIQFAAPLCKSLLSLLFPWACPGCGLLLPYPKVLCETCVVSLKKIAKPCCKRCGNPFPVHWRVRVCSECHLGKTPLTKIRSVYYYEDLVKTMVRDAKFSRKVKLLCFFAEEMYVLARNEFPSNVQALVPVPLHRSREWERTFNQAERVAAEMSRYWGVPVWDVLRKIQKTKSQSSLSEGARRKNLQGVFVCKNAARIPRSVVLIDDVMTTGTTLRECSRTLRRAGVKRVYGLTIARVVKQF